MGQGDYPVRQPVFIVQCALATSLLFILWGPRPPPWQITGLFCGKNGFQLVN